MPLTKEQFFQVFAEYNQAIWPLQAALFLLAIVTVAGALWNNRVASTILAALWAWCGVVYHAVHFARVNPAAWLFGLLFLSAAVLMLRNAAALQFGDVPSRRLGIGSAFIAYALLIYPAVGYLAGHLYPEAATFGAPCPLTIFTLGLLLIARPPVPVSVAVAPILWSLIGTTAVFQFGMIEDLALPVAGLTCFAFLLNDRIAHPESEPSHAHA